MRFGILALDYDGTIARDGVLDPKVRAAITEARTRGIVVVLVTGRILDDLRRVAGNLNFVDAVVAENGAVIASANGHSRLLGNPPPERFLEELRRRKIAFIAGQCVVETDAAHAQQVLEIIRMLELPLAPLFNRGRLMVLPQSISKATGLRQALSALRLSPHNAIAIGDAENDHELLAACELGVAVSWGSQVLQAAADDIVHGNGPSAVAAYIRQAVENVRLSPERIGRRHLPLGATQQGRAIGLSVRGRNLLITGDPQSGKSWAAGLLCEQLILQGYCVWVIDPEGEYGGLESLPGVVVLGGGQRPPRLRDLARALRYPDVSVVLDLSHVPHTEKLQYLSSLLSMLASLRRSTGLPHRIVVDEAHYFLHEPNVKQLLDLDLGAYTLVTYRPSQLHPDVYRAVEGVIATRMNDPREIQALLNTFGDKKDAETEWRCVLPKLTIGEAVLLPGIDEAEHELQRFQMMPRLTQHVRHKTKYFDVPMAEQSAFVFTANGKPIATPARSLREFVELLASVPSEVLRDHAVRGDFSRWVADVMNDRPLAAEIRGIEQELKVGQIADLAETLSDLIKERYEIRRIYPGDPSTSPPRREPLHAPERSLLSSKP